MLWLSYTPLMVPDCLKFRIAVSNGQKAYGIPLHPSNAERPKRKKTKRMNIGTKMYVLFKNKIKME
jgi:hypothetical protein